MSLNDDSEIVQFIMLFHIGCSMWNNHLGFRKKNSLYTLISHKYTSCQILTLEKI